MVKIAPSILSADFGNLAGEINAVEKAGADWIHIDVMDGHFVPNITVGPMIVEAVNQVTDLPLDVHLMIEEPDRYIGEFVKAGADIITVHVEACPHLNSSIQNIKDHKARAGVVVNPATSLSLLEEIINDVDLVLLMSVNPGFGGQKFISSVLEKIHYLREIIDQCGGGIDLEVDGGITTQNAKSVKNAGANVLVAGSTIFNNKDYKKTILKLKNS